MGLIELLLGCDAIPNVQLQEIAHSGFFFQETKFWQSRLHYQWAVTLGLRKWEAPWCPGSRKSCGHSVLDTEEALVLRECVPLMSCGVWLCWTRCRTDLPGRLRLGHTLRSVSLLSTFLPSLFRPPQCLAPWRPSRSSYSILSKMIRENSGPGAVSALAPNPPGKRIQRPGPQSTKYL